MKMRLFRLSFYFYSVLSVVFYPKRLSLVPVSSMHLTNMSCRFRSTEHTLRAF